MLLINGVLIEPIGEADALCPSCAGALVKFPLRKVSCPHCRADIFSRVQPFDGVKRLINGASVSILERQWAEFSKLKDFVAQFHSSKIMQEYLEDLRSGRRGLANLHPSTVWACAHQLAANGLGDEWIDPLPRWFDPADVISIHIQ